MSTLVRDPRLLTFVLLGALLGAGCKSPTKPTDTSEAPKITCPLPQTAVSANGISTPVSYNPTVAGGKSPLTIGCLPVSGTAFVVGTTTVTCSTSDALMRTDSCTFNVLVTLPVQISLTNFVAFGDSITWGENGIDLLAPLGELGEELSEEFRPHFQLPEPQQYPTQLRVELANRYTAQASIIEVRNEGQQGTKPGDTSEIARFSNAITGRQAVLLMEGANQLDNIPAAINGLRQMIQIARGQNVRPYLATLPPQEDATMPPRRGNPLGVIALNAQIRSLAASEGVTLVDVFQAFPGGSLIAQGLVGSDGLHPTGAGYVYVADAFFQSLRATLETSP